MTTFVYSIITLHLSSVILFFTIIINWLFLIFVITKPSAALNIKMILAQKGRAHPTVTYSLLEGYNMGLITNHQLKH